jgi:hypothetical protein
MSVPDYRATAKLILQRANEFQSRVDAARSKTLRTLCNDAAEATNSAGEKILAIEDAAQIFMDDQEEWRAVSDNAIARAEELYREAQALEQKNDDYGPLRAKRLDEVARKARLQKELLDSLRAVGPQKTLQEAVAPAVMNLVWIMYPQSATALETITEVGKLVAEATPLGFPLAFASATSRLANLEQHAWKDADGTLLYLETYTRMMLAWHENADWLIHYLKAG